MKRPYSLLFFVLFSGIFAEQAAAQSYPFEEKWEYIEKQELDGQLKSLKPEVEELYQQSKKEQQVVHRIRALLYLLKIDLITEERPQREQELYRRFTKEIETAAGVERSILQSHLAQALDEYYRHYMGALRQRTPIHADTVTTDDLAVWSQAEYGRVIEGLYQASLENDGLKEEPTDRWELLLDTAVRNRELRPTMFDILAHRASDYYRASSYYGGHDRGAADKLLADLAAFHLEEGRISAYLYNQVLLSQQYWKGKGLDEGIAFLRSLSAAFPDNWYTSQVLYELGQLYQRKLNEFDQDAFSLRKQYADSILALSETVTRKFPESPADFSLQHMRAQIVRPNITLHTDMYVLPEQPFHAVIKHKNLHSVYVKVLPAKRSYPHGQRIMLPSHRTQQVVDSFLLANPAVQEYELALKHFGDYEERRTISVMNALPAGEYLIVLSDNKAFLADRGVVVLHQIAVSGHALVFRGDHMLLTDRQTGKPLPRQRISVYTADRKPGLQSVEKQGLQLLQQLTTDEYGMARLVRNERLQRQSSRLFFRVGNEPVLVENQSYRPASSTNKKDTIHTLHFFTDRAIYRPGQTVHFKGILHQKTPGQHSVLTGHATTVYLVDPNNKRVDSLQLTTNTYGSVAGKFITPAVGLTGTYYLVANKLGRKELRVEEYKRPGFEIRMDTVGDTYRLGQEITATGRAVSFSGGSMANAKVAYRVVRQNVYPYRVWDFSSRHAYALPAEVASGETVTDGEGTFQVPFTAIPGDRAGTERFRFYRYDIFVTVTDISGETQKGLQRIPLGDKSVLLDIRMPETVTLSELDSITITTTNLNGRRIAATGGLQITKLGGGERVLRNQVFDKIDYMIQDSVSFVTLFPDLPYMNDHLPENRPKGRRVFQSSYDTGVRSTIAVNGMRRSGPGTYILEAFVVDGTDTLRISRRFILSDPAQKKPEKSTFLEVSALKKIYQPGEYAEVLLSSALPDATVLVEVEEGGTVVHKALVRLDNTIKKWRIPVAASQDRQLMLHYYISKFNSVKTGVIEIAVRQPESGLKLSAGTFRSSLEPGQEETWELLIKGAGNENVAAETLAGMYDAALDKFAANDFRLALEPPMRQGTGMQWNVFNSIRVVNSAPVRLQRPTRLYTPMKYESLERFGFSLTARSRSQEHYLSRLKDRGQSVVRGSGFYDFQSFGELNEVVVVGYGDAQVALRGTNSITSAGDGVLYVVDGEIKAAPPADIQADDILSMKVLKGPEATTLYGAKAANGVVVITTRKAAEAQLQQVKARTDLRETAFFFPDLMTDAEGNVKISFQAPERLTQWKFMAFAHTKEMQTGYLELPVQTRKNLMVEPHVPRFVREGDEVVITAKVNNRSGRDVDGGVKLSLLDPYTMQPIDSLYNLSGSLQSFSVPKGGSTTAGWRLNIPEGGADWIVYRIAAATDEFSDGEEAMLPVLPRRVLVTETLHMQVPAGQSRNFTMKPLAEAGADSRHVRLALDVSAHPAWHALQALPYLKDYPYKSSDQLANRLYSAGIAHAILETLPEVNAFFAAERKRSGGKKISGLQELINVALEETPWLLEADSERERVRLLARMTKPGNLQQLWRETLQELQAQQLPSGGFPWFSGGSVNQVISTQIVASLGRLQQLPVAAIGLGDTAVYLELLRKALTYLDDEAEARLSHSMAKAGWSAHSIVHYLYARSYFLKKYPLRAGFTDSLFARLQALSRDRIVPTLQHRAMEATVYKRYGRAAKARQLTSALREYAVTDEETGMYWRDNAGGWCWWQNPVETQALLIEAFSEVNGDTNSVSQMQWWLLRNKQGAYWRGTRATIAAVQALLFGPGGEVVPVPSTTPVVKVAGQEISGALQSALPGVIQHTWKPDEITPATAQVEMTNAGSAPVRGALHWQRLEDISQVQSAASDVSIRKELFLKNTVDGEEVLQPLKAGEPVKTGDLLTVRLVIRSDRDMDFVHLKDVRPGGAEPVNVLSSYKWQHGLAYYESTRDAATHFFIDRIREGTYVFEYDLRAAHSGSFTTGMATLQSLYLPDMVARGVYQGVLLVD